MLNIIDIIGKVWSHIEALQDRTKALQDRFSDFVTGKDLRESLVALQRDHATLLDAMVTDLGDLRTRSIKAQEQLDSAMDRLQKAEVAQEELRELKSVADTVNRAQRDHATLLDAMVTDLSDLRTRSIKAQEHLDSAMERLQKAEVAQEELRELKSVAETVNRVQRDHENRMTTMATILQDLQTRIGGFGRDISQVMSRLDDVERHGVNLTSSLASTGRQLRILRLLCAAALLAAGGAMVVGLVVLLR